MPFRRPDHEIHLNDGEILINCGTWRYITQAAPADLTVRAVRAFIVKRNSTYLAKLPVSRVPHLLRDAMSNERHRLSLNTK